ncbi:glycoside hydrolase family 16 protein [Belliella sp. R4-6]|uniref:Glycoside hydrolase family 16 protein n=1 Tax=Belliella alkalica TaxID=1730871 RepID=A0ABS9VDE5_9BACT|nr:glycoside hydrolase family 16 protein [Belliella alkalica]MCH7414249.1 glycoside hydrolase family 16 protein [Belliella alkalica]
MNFKYLSTALFGLVYMSCSSPNEKEVLSESAEQEYYKLEVGVEGFHLSSEGLSKQVIEGDTTVVMNEGQWVCLDVDFAHSGRYKVEFLASTSKDSAQVWLEDYYDNKDERTYDVSGKVNLISSLGQARVGVEGSPFRKGLHKMKLHASKGIVAIDKVIFTLMKDHSESKEILEQNTSGEEWSLVWSDEFDGDVIDSTKWTYDFGDWGWGNNELQYYTEAREENARIEDGNLIIEARKGDFGKQWTSARLTTRGKVAFLYGKIEFRAKVPKEKGNWAAGWTLGNTYVDEKDWPYSGEIDILESVGYEVDNETGDGIAHATVHTPAYYFKIGNQISNKKEVENIAGEWHTYSVEWSPTEIKMLVDDETYYLYDKNANDKEWPFHIPQNIILNLAIGGGWGGSQGIDPNMTSQMFVIDYVRVFGKK